jgi:hypothetical protein
MNIERNLPDFLGIGCQNAGTTWLSACISQHPEIYLAPQKEVSFFDMRFDKGWDWYMEQFDSPNKYKIRGEWSPGYICNENAFNQAAKKLPDIRVLALFRNPVDRLYSHYCRYRSQGATHLPLEAAIRKDPSYVRMSLYANDWEKWATHYGNDRCHAILFEDLVANPLHCMQEIFSFLNVDTSFIADADLARSRQNEVHMNKHQWIMDFIAQGRDTLRRTPLSPLVDIAKSLGMKDMVKSMTVSKKGGYRGFSLTQDDRNKIFGEYFKDDVERLQLMMPQIDFSKWKPPV